MCGSRMRERKGNRRSRVGRGSDFSRQTVFQKKRIDRLDFMKLYYYKTTTRFEPVEEKRLSTKRRKRKRTKNVTLHVFRQAYRLESEQVREFVSSRVRFRSAESKGMLPLKQFPTCFAKRFVNFHTQKRERVRMGKKNSPPIDLPTLFTFEPPSFHTLVLPKVMNLM